jgi:gp45 sliding clamp, C terminal
MKLSENTLSVLKNFSSINSGIVLQKGNLQKTISPEKSILVEAEIEDVLPEQFGIYDLNQFLGNVSTLNNPELTFSENSVLMNDGEITFNYYSCSTNLIVSPPDKELKLKQVDVSFTLTNANLTKLLRLAAMNNLTHLSVVGKNGEIRLQTHEKANDTSNYASFKLNDYNGEDFTASFKVENIKLIPGDYDVEIQLGAFAKFVSKSGKIKYFIALESK